MLNDAYPSPSDLYYSYSFDTEGYVTKKVEYNGLSGTEPKTTLYDYVMTNITLNLWHLYTHTLGKLQPLPITNPFH